MNSIFRFTKRIIPQISDTELIALRSGTTSIDRDIFRGTVPIKKEAKPFGFEEQNLYNKLDSNVYFS